MTDETPPPARPDLATTRVILDKYGGISYSQTVLLLDYIARLEAAGETLEHYAAAYQSIMVGEGVLVEAAAVRLARDTWRQAVGTGEGGSGEQG